MYKRITVKTGIKSYVFFGRLLDSVEGQPYSDLDDFHEYAVYEREKDKYFVCVNYSKGTIKCVESEKQLVDVFGFNPIAKQLYERLNLNVNVVISTFDEGIGNQYFLTGHNDKNYELVGQLIHRSFCNDGADQLEVYKLNIGGYIRATKSIRGYLDVELLDERALVETIV